MKILMPGRILDRNVGGNTTYARELRRGLSARGVSVESIPMGRTAVHTLARESAVAIARSEPGTVLHYVADTGPLVGRNPRALVTVHGVASRWIKTARRRDQEAVWRFRVAAAIRNCQRVITVSESSADDIASVFSIDRQSLRVIPHGIAVQEFAEPREPSTKIAMQLPPEFLLYVGNIEPRKNLVELVRAVESDRSLPPLVVAGKPAWNFRASMEAIEAAERVTYLGFVSDDDRAALMQKCVAFVFPSLYEGFGFPVLEAMAAGARVITTRNGALSEVAGPAWTLKGAQRDEIAAGISQAVGDRQWMDQSRREGKDWAAQYSWDASVENHLKVYREIAN